MENSVAAQITTNGFPSDATSDALDKMVAEADATNLAFKQRDPVKWAACQERARRYLARLLAPVPPPSTPEEHRNLENAVHVESCLIGQFDYYLEDVEDRGAELADAIRDARELWLDRATEILVGF